MFSSSAKQGRRRRLGLCGADNNFAAFVRAKSANSPTPSPAPPEEKQKLHFSGSSESAPSIELNKIKQLRTKARRNRMGEQKQTKPT